MALRKASAYSRKLARPFTRISRNKSKAYIKTVPGSKIAKFAMGNQKDYEQGKHKYIIRLIADENVQVRDNALESGRMYLSKFLDENAPGQYFFAVRVYPHHFLRENKTAAGAGADRLSSGMKHSYGIIIGRAAMVRSGQEIFFISCATDKAARDIRTAVARIKAKIPSRTSVVFEEKK